MNSSEGQPNSQALKGSESKYLRMRYAVWRFRKHNYLYIVTSAYSDNYVLHVHMPNKSFKAIGFNKNETVLHIIKKTVEELCKEGHPPSRTQRYACRMLNVITKEVCGYRKNIWDYNQYDIF